MQVSEPYVSFVVTARNDDHGGNLLARMQLFVTGLLELTKKHQLQAELIIVEWNPVPNRPRLWQALHWPHNIGPCAVRVIEVSPEIHRRFQYSDKILLFQMIAKNVGIRRARGIFVLATNIDLLFSDELIRFLASRSLEPRFMYRIDRYDVPSDIPNSRSIEEQLDYCRGHVIRVNTRYGTFPASGPSSMMLILAGLSLLNRSLLLFMPQLSKADLIAAVERVKRWIVIQRVRTWIALGRVRTWIAHMPEAFLSSMLTLARDILCNVFRSCGEVVLTSSRVCVSFLVRRARLTSRGIRFVRRLLFPEYPRLHTNACGDFTLIAREHWNSVRGYPEFRMFSWNLDSILCHAVVEKGLAEKVLQDPMRIYHISHSLFRNVDLFGRHMTEGSMRKSLGDIPILDNSQAVAWILKMHKQNIDVVVNDQFWGLASEDLPETVIT